MVAKTKQIRIPLSAVTEGIERGVDGADQARADNLEGLHKVRAAKNSGLERERVRLGARLGRDHLRVAALSRKIEVNQALTRQLAFDTERAKTVAPVPEEQAWIVHGHVRNRDLSPASGLTVAIYNEKGSWVRELGHACTDAAGHFILRHEAERDGTEPRGDTETGTTIGGIFTDEPPPNLHLHVLDKRSTLLHHDGALLTPGLGKVDYREIILGDGDQVCPPPEPAPEPAPPVKPTPSEPPRLEDIDGIGPARAEKLRSAGIVDLQEFIEADDRVLKRILGDIDVKEMKRIAKKLLRDSRG